MALIGRFFVICFALIVASLAAGMVFAAGLLGPQWRSFSGDAVEQGMFWSMTLVSTGIAWFAGFLPLLVAVVLAEALKIRSLLIYVAASAAMFVVGAIGTGVANTYEESIDTAATVLPSSLNVPAAAGIAFGLMYWLLAGRNAGRWRERP